MADLEGQIMAAATKQKLPVKSVVCAVQIEWHDDATPANKAAMDAIVAAALNKQGDAQ